MDTTGENGYQSAGYGVSYERGVVSSGVIALGRLTHVEEWHLNHLLELLNLLLAAAHIAVGDVWFLLHLHHSHRRVDFWWQRNVNLVLIPVHPTSSERDNQHLSQLLWTLPLEPKGRAGTTDTYGQMTKTCDQPGSPLFKENLKGLIHGHKCLHPLSDSKVYHEQIMAPIPAQMEA